jgi:hypothetical protein
MQLVPLHLGHLINDAAMPPTDAADIVYAQEYLKRTTNDTNCHAVPFPSAGLCTSVCMQLHIFSVTR